MNPLDFDVYVMIALLVAAYAVWVLRRSRRR